MDVRYRLDNVYRAANRVYRVVRNQGDIMLMTFDQFIDRCEQERLDRMHIEANRRRRNERRRYRAWAVYTIL